MAGILAWTGVINLLPTVSGKASKEENVACSKSAVTLFFDECCYVCVVWYPDPSTKMRGGEGREAGLV